MSISILLCELYEALHGFYKSLLFTFPIPRAITIPNFQCRANKSGIGEVRVQGLGLSLGLWVLGLLGCLHEAEFTPRPLSMVTLLETTMWNYLLDHRRGYG